jgi:hypothetical protein
MSPGRCVRCWIPNRASIRRRREVDVAALFTAHTWPWLGSNAVITLFRGSFPLRRLRSPPRTQMPQHRTAESTNYPLSKITSQQGKLATDRAWPHQPLGATAPIGCQRSPRLELRVPRLAPEQSSRNRSLGSSTYSEFCCDAGRSPCGWMENIFGPRSLSRCPKLRSSISTRRISCSLASRSVTVARNCVARSAWS